MNSVVPKANSKAARLTLARPLQVRVSAHADGPPLDAEPLQAADFLDVASEAWREGCLRKGFPRVPLAELPIRLEPIPTDDAPARCAGLKAQMELPDGTTTQCLFTFGAVRSVADRIAQRLLRSGGLTAGQHYYYEVVRDDCRLPAPETPGSAATFQLRTAPLAILTAPLRFLLERSTPVALLEPEDFPVFYTCEAFRAAESCARRGELASLETGGALFGSLATCPESGEFFVLVRDTVEVRDAEEKPFSLGYSGSTWEHLQKIQRARQAAFPADADRLLGQAHGHPFRPNDGKICAECERRPTCLVTSAWASADDQSWHKAVFARQPWALCHIFGLSARAERVHQLFGLKDGRLQPRGFYLLPSYPI